MNIYIRASKVIRNLPDLIRLPIRILLNIARIIIWWLDGLSAPPPYAYKIFVLAYYAIKYKTKVFIETGTYMGDTVDSLKYFFNKIYTIELDDRLFEMSKEFLKKYKNINVIHGDSGKVIPFLLKEVRQTTLFWLDAHYSGEGTARGEKDTPIMKELRNINHNRNYKDVILIDDARCFNGKNSYPQLAVLKSYIKRNWKNVIIECKNDIIRIYPK